MLVGLISRQQLLKASRRGPWSLLRIVRIVPLERMARHLGVEACGLRAGYRTLADCADFPPPPPTSVRAHLGTDNALTMARTFSISSAV